jgi:outer membrane protein assembly factor BamB
MKKLTTAVIALVLTATTLPAQLQTARLHSHPGVPPQEALDRLNLQLAWRTYVPTDGSLDGIFSVQVLEDMILVQTRSGGIATLNPETGRRLWYAQVGIPFRVSQPLGYNSRSVFGYNGTNLYSVNRKTGQLEFEFNPKSAPSAPPVADEERLYLATGGGRLYVYELPPKNLPIVAAGPKPEAPPEPKLTTAYALSAQRMASIGPLSGRKPLEIPKPDYSKPLFLWDYRVLGQLELAPLLAGDILLLADTNGMFFALPQLGRQPQYSFKADARLNAPMAEYVDHREVLRGVESVYMAYVASDDFSVYALDMLAGRIAWRFATGGPIMHKPVVMDEDVYVGTRGAGLYRISRADGHEIWRNREASRFVAANKKLAYAMDGHGRLMVLDHARGTRLTTYDTHDFPVPVANELTDRVFLASNDGLLVCLHDKAYPAPLRNKTIAAVEKPAKKGAKTPAKGEEKKPAEK